MRTAVIGRGNIGGTLGSKWRAAGHDVVWFALVKQNGGNRKVALRVVS